MSPLQLLAGVALAHVELGEVVLAQTPERVGSQRADGHAPRVIAPAAHVGEVRAGRARVDAGVGEPAPLGGGEAQWVAVAQGQRPGRAGGEQQGNGGGADQTPAAGAQSRPRGSRVGEREPDPRHERGGADPEGHGRGMGGRRAGGVAGLGERPVDGEQRRRGEQRAHAGHEREARHAQAVAADDDRDHEHGREREQPAAALGQQREVEPGAGEAEQQAAHEHGKLAAGGEPDRQQRRDGEQGRVGVEIARRRDEPALAEQAGGPGRVGHVDERDHADHPDGERVDGQHGEGLALAPRHAGKGGEHEQVEQGAVRTRQRVAGRGRPGDRGIGEGHIGAQQPERPAHRGAQRPAGGRPADGDRHGEQRQRAPVPRIEVIAAVVAGPHDHEREREVGARGRRVLGDPPAPGARRAGVGARR